MERERIGKIIPQSRQVGTAGFEFFAHPRAKIYCAENVEMGGDHKPTHNKTQPYINACNMPKKSKSIVDVIPQ